MKTAAQAVPELVPARMINEALFCERLLYLEWAQGEFANNFFTADGNTVHERPDHPGGQLPVADEMEENRPYQARSVWLSSEKLGITAKIDVVDGARGGVVPVEYKRGRAPEVPEGAYLPERAQLCAQVLLLREHGYRVDGADLYFARTKRRVAIKIDASLIDATKLAARRAREVCASSEMPPPLVDSPKCTGCSLVGICLPDETRLLQSTHGSGELAPVEVRAFAPARDDRPRLHVQEAGSRVGLRGDCIVVRSREGEEVGEARLVHTAGVSIYGNVQVSTQALREFLSRDISVSFFTSGGWYCGRTVSADSKNVAVRIAQFRAFSDEAFCLPLARSLVASKIRNCRTLLRRNGSNVPANILARLEKTAAQVEQATGLETLLGFEGTAARLYFGLFGSMLKSEHGFNVDGRNRRPPRDPVNALLSLAYALLVKDWVQALLTCGLDPLLGFYHQPRFGRPSLALDLMEEFRPVLADSTVLTAINTGVVSEADFTRSAGAVALTSTARRNFIQSYERRLDQLVVHPVFGYKVSYRRVLEVQARLLTRLLLGEIDTYPTFKVR